MLRALAGSNIAGWLEEIGGDARIRLFARARNLDSHLAVGALGKVEIVVGKVVQGGDPAVWEFRGTHRGARAPHLRMLGHFQRGVPPGGATFWAAHGLNKQNNKLRRADIHIARVVINRWLELR